MAAIKGVRSPVHAEPHPSASDSTARPNGYHLISSADGPDSRQWLERFQRRFPEVRVQLVAFAEFGVLDRRAGTSVFLLRESGIPGIPRRHQDGVDIGRLQRQLRLPSASASRIAVSSGLPPLRLTIVAHANDLGQAHYYENRHNAPENGSTFDGKRKVPE